MTTVGNPWPPAVPVTSDGPGAGTAGLGTAKLGAAILGAPRLGAATLGAAARAPAARARTLPAARARSRLRCGDVRCDVVKIPLRIEPWGSALAHVMCVSGITRPCVNGPRFRPGTLSPVTDVHVGTIAPVPVPGTSVGLPAPGA